jgi:hypothetical protein
METTACLLYFVTGTPFMYIAPAIPATHSMPYKPW